ncbi:MAG: hypothetical protein JO021_21590 [Alphaproteobacteria bacterium]|nr:hypothetical protein [Alphaproteobacteria bacterium]
MASCRAVGTLVVAALAVSGCAVERSNHADRARTDLVGISKAELFSCAGLPDDTQKVGDDEFVTYRNDLLTSGGITMPIIGGGVNFFDSKYCHATFVIRNGRAQALHYAGNASSLGAELDQCGYIIDTCIEHLDHVRKEAGRPVTAAELGAPPPETQSSAAPEKPTGQTAEKPPEQKSNAAAKRRHLRAAP